MNSNSRSIQEARLATQKLGSLIGHPMVAVRRACDWQMFSFGNWLQRVARYGPSKEKLVSVPEFALHIQCSWRICKDDHVLVGSQDRFFTKDGEVITESQPGEVLLDVNVRRIREEMKASPTDFVVQRVNVNALLDLVIHFAGGYLLQAGPYDSLKGDSQEYWRFFHKTEKGNSPHLVATANGVRGL